MPVVGFERPEDHVDGGGLAGAVRAEERDDLALLELEVDPADRLDAAEGLGDAGQLGRRRSSCAVLVEVMPPDSGADRVCRPHTAVMTPA